MKEVLKEVIKKHLEETKCALEAHNFPTYIVEHKEAAKALVNQMIQDHDKVATGGSMSLEECGILDLLRTRKVEFVEHVVGAKGEELRKEMVHALLSDVFLCSANAISKQGEIYNVDGNGNRVSNMIFGPKQVIIVAGYNKIVDDMEAAKSRVCTTAAPANATRLKLKTPCTSTGKCMDCKSKDRICSAFVTMNWQKTQRIKVILVEEELGF